MREKIGKYDWCTHQELLVACATATGGDILELGCGHYSTPVLHWICVHSGRTLVTADHDRGWLRNFEYLGHPRHRLCAVDSWDTFAEIDGGPWGLAFVDHNPGSRFAIDIGRLRARSTFIVVHDTEPAKGLGLDELVSTFKYHYQDMRHATCTTAVSDILPIPGGQV